VKEMVAEYLVCFKHPGYESEREWRAVYFTDPRKPLKVRTRARDRSLISYVEFSCGAELSLNDGRLPIEEIVVGPCNDVSTTSLFLRNAMSDVWGAEITEQVRVDSSKVPYRYF
jgi:hypothetical protein